MTDNKDNQQWLIDLYSNVDSSDLIKAYQTPYIPGDLIGTFLNSYNTVRRKSWVEGENCTYDQTKKDMYIYDYVYNKEVCDKFEEYLKNAQLTKAKFAKWKKDRPNMDLPIPNDILEGIERMKKRATKKQTKKKEPEEKSLKIQIKQKDPEKQHKKEENKPKKE